MISDDEEFVGLLDDAVEVDDDEISSDDEAADAWEVYKDNTKAPRSPMEAFIAGFHAGRLEDEDDDE